MAGIDDDEIIIGVSKKEEQKKQEKNKISQSNKDKNKNKKGKTNKKKTKQQNKKKISKEITEEFIRKRAKKAKIRKIFIITILILVAIILAMFSPLFNIKNIIINGNSKISTNEIISLSQIELEENMFKVNSTKVIKQIKENAYISTVKITRNIPSTITITIEERIPAYLIECNGNYAYVDKQGYILEISQEKLELPILQGETTEISNITAGGRLEKKDLQKLEIVIKMMEVAQSIEISNLITRIDIKNIDDIELIFETKEKTAHLGNGTNLLNKMNSIKRILEKEEGNKGEIFVNMDLNKDNPVFRQSV